MQLLYPAYLFLGWYFEIIYFAKSIPVLFGLCIQWHHELRRRR